jgi:GR25 family glycosyltransferase involved in LPS biosynthesis
LWQQCAAGKEDYMILEHDAYFVDKVPNINYQACISLGKPSYGKYNTPGKIGVNPLTSKRYFPGAHAYMVKPKAAEILVEQARLAARPTDVFLTVDKFPWLEEYYPWPVEARDSFSTIQRIDGCVAKHNFGKKYGIEKVS